MMEIQFKETTTLKINGQMLWGFFVIVRFPEVSIKFLMYKLELHWGTFGFMTSEFKKPRLRLVIC